MGDEGRDPVKPYKAVCYFIWARLVPWLLGKVFNFVNELKSFGQAFFCCCVLLNTPGFTEGAFGKAWSETVEGRKTARSKNFKIIKSPVWVNYIS